MPLLVVPPSHAGDRGRIWGQSGSGKAIGMQRALFMIFFECGYSNFFVQEGETTPGITGAFEVTVDGKLVHSKKVLYIVAL